MPLSLLRYSSLLSDRVRTPEQEDARVESLLVMIPLSYGTMILAALAAGIWFSSVLFSKSSGNFGINVFASLFAALAAYEVYFIRRAKRIVTEAERKNEK
jgi:hypothetical protein